MQPNSTSGYTDCTGHSVQNPIETRDLATVIVTLRGEAEYVRNGHTALTLTKSAGLRVVVVCLQKGAQLPEHNAPGVFSLYVLEGSITFSVRLADDRIQSAELRAGQMLLLNEPHRHAVAAGEESAFVLSVSMSKPDSESVGSA